MAKYPGMTNGQTVVKAHYDLIYKNIVRRSDNNQMDLNCFFEALEELANRLFPYEDPYDNLSKLIKLIKKCIHMQQNPALMLAKQQEMLL